MIPSNRRSMANGCDGCAYNIKGIKSLLFLAFLAFAQATVTDNSQNTGSCKDMLQGYLTGQLSSAQGNCQVEALRRDFKTFTEIMEKSMKEFMEKVEAKLGNITEDANSSISFTRREQENTVQVLWDRSALHSQAPIDCQDYLWEGYTESGAYTIYPQRSGRLNVFCDQNTDGGGWTVIQRRQDGHEDFFRKWIDYKYGFGNITGEFWLGNHRIYEIVSQGFYELRIDMADFTGESRYAIYRRFSIADESQGFKLLVKDYIGTAGDSFSGQNGAQFYTKDHDSNSCAAKFKGGWWYTNCHESNLNGIYMNGSHSSFADGIEWKAWHGYYYSLKFTEMKIRRL